MKLTFRGVEVDFTPYRITRWDGHRYEIRRVDEVAWLERRVAIRFAGTIVSPVPVDLGPDGAAELSAAERAAFGFD